MVKEVESHVWLVRDEPEYADGWYFSDETEQFNGPFGTIDECKGVLKDYVEELDKPKATGVCPTGPGGEVRHMFIMGKMTCQCGERKFTGEKINGV